MIIDENIVGLFAQSSAGHDKGKIFLILSDEKEFVYIADGKSRTIEKPKRKNRKHLLLIKNEAKISGEMKALREKLLRNEPIRNEEVKYAIKKYSKKKYPKPTL